MKKLSVFSGILILLATIAVLSVISCSKTDANAQFFGTYVGNGSSGGSNYSDTVVISSGGNSTSITLHDTHSTYTVNGTVSGNSISIPSQTVSSATVTGSGTLSGGNLNISLTGTVVGIVPVTYGFSGTRQ